MPAIKVVGHPKPIHISQNLMEKIVRGKLDADGDQSHIVDVQGYGFVELAQIKQILPDEPGLLAENELQDEKKRIRWEKEMDYEREISGYRLQTPEEKARRTAKTWALLLWTIRGNWEQVAPVPILTRGDTPTAYGSRIPQELEDKFVERMIPYFREHTDEWTCTRDVYQDLIPFKKKNVPHSAVKGAISLGDALTDEAKVENMLSQVQF